MTIRHITKEKKIIFLTVRETLKSKTLELTKKSTHKIMNLETELKNEAFNKVNFLLNTVEMFSYDKEDLFVNGSFRETIENTFKDNVNFFIKLSEAKEDVDIYTVNFSSLINTHNNSSRLKYDSQEGLKKVFLSTRETYKDLVESSQKDAFKDHYITYSPKKIKFKIWKEKEPRPEQVNTDEGIFNNKFITEVYSNSKKYISIEANKDGLFLISKNMDDKSKDIKVSITLSLIEKLEKLLNEEPTETQIKTITPAAVKPAAQAKPVAPQPTPKPVQKAVEKPVDQPSTKDTPTPPVAVVDEVEEIVDDVEAVEEINYEEATDDEQDQLDGYDESDLPN